MLLAHISSPSVLTGYSLFFTHFQILKYMLTFKSQTSSTSIISDNCRLYII